MKIIQVLCHCRGGGAEEHAFDLAMQAKKSGHEVGFVLGEANGFARRLAKNKIPFQTIEMKSSFNPFQVLKSILFLRKYFKEEKPDIVQAHMLREHSLALGAKFLGAKVKVVRTFHRLDQFNWKMLPLIWFYRWQTDYFIAISEFIENYLRENGINKKMIVIHNGVPEVMAKSHAKALGYLGRVTKEKGILKFIEENLKELQKTKLVVAGDGPDLEKIINLKQSHSLNIETLGRVEDKPKFFESISTLILPSESEVLPLVVLESYSAGVPVVTFALPALENVVTEETGKMVEKGDYKGLYQEAVNLLNNPKRLAVKKVYDENYNIDKMWLETEKLYKSLEKR